MSDTEIWRWVWLGAMAVFAIGEMAVAGNFFLAPFAIGAAVAAILAFAGAGLVWQWLAFVIVSGGAFAALRPLAHRLDIDDAGVGVGSQRLVGQRATVVEAIPAGHDLGIVLINREQWRAESENGAPIAAGTPVEITDVQGTRVIVRQLPFGPLAR